MSMGTASEASRNKIDSLLVLRDNPREMKQKCHVDELDQELRDRLEFIRTDRARHMTREELIRVVQLLICAGSREEQEAVVLVTFRKHTATRAGRQVGTTREKVLELFQGAEARLGIALGHLKRFNLIRGMMRSRPGHGKEE